MSDRIWGYLGLFFTITIIIGGLTLAYFGERNQLGMIMESRLIKFSIILYCMLGVFIMVFSEVRKRVEIVNVKTIGITLAIILVIIGYLVLTRL
ncbi:hypothetical protein [Lederbergia lenta]|uniref:Uncharacterized protein n=1 Tax=Lederbergia lenta TaxID=1467 RepID=A0A2X4W002_LEDLE|nr:hypothetical protein [Lederbergia lenta]MCM3113228.1 hypothetical protein [Lederbergia lenta]MEC2325983.1 hypothetical protein [Lederbergia lenta]SQI53408.1 Uncharacterised protein [Lederbergia lenta]